MEVEDNGDDDNDDDVRTVGVVMIRGSQSARGVDSAAHKSQTGIGSANGSKKMNPVCVENGAATDGGGITAAALAPAAVTMTDDQILSAVE